MRLTEFSADTVVALLRKQTGFFWLGRHRTGAIPTHTCFRRLPILAEELNDGGDGVVRRFDVAGAGRFRPVNAMFLTHITLGRPKWLYASVGTTADRNIFRNVMLGVSGYIPKWWSAVSVGVIAARGSGEDATREAFGALTNPITGLALGSPSGVRGTEGWHYRGFLGVSFNPFAR